MTPDERGDLLIPAVGGPRNVGWLRVPDPPPLELDRGADGFFVLDEVDGERRYVHLAA